MSRRTLPPQKGRAGRRANQMAPGGRLRSESPIREFYVSPGETGVAPPVPTGLPATSCYVSHLYYPDRPLPTDSWQMTSMCLYVASRGSSGLRTPSGWSVLASGVQGADTEYHLMKVDNMTPGVVNSVGMQLSWSNVGQYVFHDGVLFRWFGGSGGRWSHIAGAVYNKPFGTFGEADWTSPGGAVRHCQVIHATSLWTGYDGAGEIGMASGGMLGVGHHAGNGGYSGAAFDNWQANPRSGHIDWTTLGAYGPPLSTSFALTWSP
jgi:hypothetical protein